MIHVPRKSQTNVAKVTQKDTLQVPERLKKNKLKKLKKELRSIRLDYSTAAQGFDITRQMLEVIFRLGGRKFDENIHGLKMLKV